VELADEIQRAAAVSAVLRRAVVLAIIARAPITSKQQRQDFSLGGQFENA
jgi:hypothetical protein